MSNGICVALHFDFLFALTPKKRQKLIPETQGTCFRTFLYTATTTAAAAAADAATVTATATATNIIIINYYLIKRGAYM